MQLRWDIIPDKSGKRIAGFPRFRTRLGTAPDGTQNGGALSCAYGFTHARPQSSFVLLPYTHSLIMKG